MTESVLADCLEVHGRAVTREPFAQWVIGCHGLHSIVREAAGVDFPGTDIEAQWAVFDATVEGWNSDYDLVPRISTSRR